MDKAQIDQKDVFEPYILNYVTEGLNNLIRQIIRAHWGMPKFENLRLRALAFNL